MPIRPEIGRWRGQLGTRTLADLTLLISIMAGRITSGWATIRSLPRFHVPESDLWTIHDRDSDVAAAVYGLYVATGQIRLNALSRTLRRRAHLLGFDSLPHHSRKQ